jgi:hypothetical protein
MRYRDWNHFGSEHPEAQALMDSDHDFEFLTAMKAAIIGGRVITDRMHKAIQNCVNKSEATRDSSLARQGIARPEVGVELRIQFTPKRLKLADGRAHGNAGARFEFSGADNLGRPARMCVHDLELVNGVLINAHSFYNVTNPSDATLDELVEGTYTDGLTTGNVTGPVVWTAGYFYILDVTEGVIPGRVAMPKRTAPPQAIAVAAVDDRGPGVVKLVDHSDWLSKF